ncbi:MAG: YlqD family protein [Armatimonadota bacterium]|nr:YlqD family protein [Armatimonadota bacterium]MDR7422077.1 YlqD family protein [Armatimonadota bacterium]MDR7454141.1 YlqD family protein [Armatimonadota bacterium]MDR7456240.1 YlqD family protein [Armatimonadota bacterium]MDR7496892.1 YlqD family protein [Armatimonadota bacterium]
MGMTVVRPVVIKAIVTEAFKKQYISDLEETVRRLDAVVQQIDVQIRRAELERQLTPQMRAFRQQLEVERSRQEAARLELQARIKEAEGLELNSEFSQGTIESLVQLNVGDNFLTRLGRAEVVVKDGIVIEIREE